jgi:hypothetical protein
MRTLLITLMLLAISLVASAAPTGPAAVVLAGGHAPLVSVPLECANWSVFSSPLFAPGLTLDKGDSVVGYALINGTKLRYQNITDYGGLPASTAAWKDAQPAPINSVSGG